jgi:hypothetical protein
LQEEAKMSLLNLLGRSRSRKKKKDIINDWQPWVTFTLKCDDCGSEFDLDNLGEIGIGNNRCGVLPGKYGPVYDLIEFLQEAARGGWRVGFALSGSKAIFNFCPYCLAGHLIAAKQENHGATWLFRGEQYITPSISTLNEWKVNQRFDEHCAYGCKQKVRYSTDDQFFTGPDFVQMLVDKGWTGMTDQHGDIYTACPDCMLVWKTDSEGYDYLGVMPKAEYAQLAGVR